MSTFVVLWNPQSYEWPRSSRDAFAKRIAIAGLASEGWSTGTRSTGIAVGDRIFLVKVQERPLGVIASGTARSEIFMAAGWSEFEDEDAPYVDVAWDVLLGPDDVLDRSYLQQAIPGQSWTFRGGGVRLPDQVAEKLESAWSSHRAALTGGGTLSRPPELERFQQLHSRFSSQGLVNTTAVWNPGRLGGTNPAAVDRLLAAPGSADALTVLAMYLEVAELPSGTWSLSCLPQVKAGLGRRRAYTVSIGGTEVIYTWLDRFGRFILWGVRVSEKSPPSAASLGFETDTEEPTEEHGQFMRHHDPLAIVAALASKSLRASIVRAALDPTYAGRTRRDLWHNERLAELVQKLSDEAHKDPASEGVARRYQMALARQRRHQQQFKKLLLDHYPHQCAVCGFGLVQILEAAHLVPDGSGGASNVENGRLMCPNHHRAHDAGLFAFVEDTVVWMTDKERFGRPTAP